MDLTLGLLGRWSLEDGNIQDLSGNGWHGTLNGGMGALTNGPRGKDTLLFDGSNDYISIATGFTLAFPLTIAAWVRPTNFSDYRNILTKRDSFTDTTMVWQFDCEITSGNVRLLHGASSSTEFTFAPTAGIWTHLAVTADGADDNLYVNGDYRQTVANTRALGTGTGSTVQISAFNGTNERFIGGIADVRAYNRILSAIEIHALFMSGFDNLPTNKYRSGKVGNGMGRSESWT